MLCMAFMTQLPKRFCWRARPFAVGRAIKVKGLETSSFPSRAVVGAVVYAAWLTTALDQSDWDHGIRGNASGCRLPPWLPRSLLAWGWIVGATFLASAARVLLGVHYASDCVAGAILGIFIHLAGTGLTRWHFSSCHCCDDHSPAVGDSWTTASVAVVILGCLLSGALLLLLSAPPLEFWRKFTHAGSLLLPPLIFILAFLCPTLSGNPRLYGMEKTSSTRAAIGVTLVAFFSGCGFATQKKVISTSLLRQLAAFLVLTSLELLALAAARLWIPG
uniref:Phosphatidic acid phosphatase type 2/haloperoxidase domain-containing protein n=1 Tax=Rhizochromulina marina TaxID=1034831 RepID=A0A7S2WCT8_9STRA